MHYYIKRAAQDLLKNGVLNTLSILTISLAILITSAFVLFFVNTTHFFNLWKSGLKVMVYLQPKLSSDQISQLNANLEGIMNIEEVTFISGDEALMQLKQQMEGQSSLFANLDQNPLPDAFELRVQAESLRGEDVDRIVAEIESYQDVETVEYGRQWLDRFTAIYDMVRLAGYSIGGLFFLAAIFIVANTIRLVLYSRREEIEIMQLVGATDRFITTPLYFEGLLQGAFGGLIGLAILYGTYIFIKTKVDTGLSETWFAMRFLPLKTTAAIVCASMFIGWLGCFVSLKQFFKQTTPK